MRFPPDFGLAQMLESNGLTPDAMIGYGGEARVYALDEGRVLRVYRQGTDLERVERRTALLSELARSRDRVPFSIPEVLEPARTEGRIATVERRLPGRPLTEILRESEGDAREALVRAYLEAAARIRDLAIEASAYGDLCQSEPISTETFQAYLEQRAARNLAVAGPPFERVDPAALARALPEPAGGAFVHLDAYPGNMLSDGRAITAVIDFGVVAIRGDARLDPLSAAAYLSPLITPGAIEADGVVATHWLSEHGMGALYEPARRWIAAFWSPASNDDGLHRWCRSVLLESHGEDARSAASRKAR
ncbi:MAG: aminoglycoside phosphotransferase family protein [Myxococcota bacterium]|nr:aminoglycoside phosphotransferase family protein [Myxococcota bacterium]